MHKYTYIQIQQTPRMIRNSRVVTKIAMMTNQSRVNEELPGRKSME